MMRFPILLVLSVLLLVAPVKAQETSDASADFEAFWRLYDRHYALFDVKDIDWSAIGDRYRDRVTSDTTRDELYEISEDALDHLDDVHVTVRDARSDRMARSGRRSIRTGAYDDGTLDLRVIARFCDDRELSNGGGGTMHSCRMGDIGYLRTSSFEHPTTRSSFTDRAIVDFEGPRAVIVDVLHNAVRSDAVVRVRWLPGLPTKRGM